MCDIQGVPVERFFWVTQSPGSPRLSRPEFILRIFHTLKYQASMAQWKSVWLACEGTLDRSRPTPKLFLKWTELDFSGQFYSAPQLQVTTFTLLLPRAFIYLSKKKIKNMFFLCSHGSIFRHSLCSYKQPRNLFWSRSTSHWWTQSAPTSVLGEATGV